jgi:hypothetical protein
MQTSYLPFLGFWIAGIIFLWMDVLIGHLGGKLHNHLMWIPLVVLPLAALSGAVLMVQGPQKGNPFFLKWLSWILILTGLAGSSLHGSAVFGKLQGAIEWGVLVRMIRYPPVLAPLGITGLGILGLLLLGKDKRESR